MYDEDDLLPLSALEHLVFCERQCALIHIEQVWHESAATVEGRNLHERPHDAGTESRGDIRIARGLMLRSLRLGLSGKTDVVEFHLLTPALSSERRGGGQGRPLASSLSSERTGAEGEGLTASYSLSLEREREGVRVGPTSGVVLPGVSGHWRPFPVEYKRGRMRHEQAYAVQVCAQALCLEEMLGVTVPKGALYYGKSARRQEVVFDEALRRKTEKAAERLHELFRSRETPKAEYVKNKCRECSLVEVCLPDQTTSSRSVKTYLARLTAESSPQPSPHRGEGEEDTLASSVLCDRRKGEELKPGYSPQQQGDRRQKDVERPVTPSPFQGEGRGEGEP